MKLWDWFRSDADQEGPVATGLSGPGPVDDADPSQADRVASLVGLARGGRDAATDTPELLAAERSTAFQRYNGILAAYVPWLLRKVGRKGSVIEIGCGSGSSTAAFAHATNRIIGYDIDATAVDEARERFRILGIHNAEAHAVQPGSVARIFDTHPRIDGVIFYATLDHIPRDQRRALLADAWASLATGGFLLIGESVNGLIDPANPGGVRPEDISAALGPNYTDWLISRPDDPEIMGIFGNQDSGEALVASHAANAGLVLPPSLQSAFLSLLLVKPDAPRPQAESDIDIPTRLPGSSVAAQGGLGSAADVEALRALARDPANFDLFAELMTEALTPHVYLNWEHDAAYKRHFKRWQKAGFTVLPNHYYSPVPDLNVLTQDQLSARYPLHGVAIDEGEHRALLSAFKMVQAETTAFRTRNTPTTDGRWYSGGAFGLLDAQVAYAMVRTQKPKRIIEIGTGFSTLAMAEACERNAAEGHPVEFTTIDPYPSFAVALNPKGLTRNLTVPVESLPIESFEALEAGDILFIDSTHVIRPGGDVEYEYFHILPRLKPGVWIHVHDIFFPLPYPPEWARDRHIFWNEQQLLMAFLTYNHSFRARMALSAASDRWIDAVKDSFPGTGDRPGPGSFWMQRIA